MWVISGIISVLFCIIGWITVVKKSKNAILASACSLSFTAITLLMEYKTVLVWVNKEDWSALLDVVPYMFKAMVVYVIVMVIANAVTFLIAKER